VVFELAQSGESIKFPAKGVEILTESISITGNPVEAFEVIVTQ
jgi:hypothetical protein